MRICFSLIGVLLGRLVPGTSLQSFIIQTVNEAESIESLGFECENFEKNHPELSESELEKLWAAVEVKVMELGRINFVYAVNSGKQFDCAVLE
jgi:hypothetical protein